MLPLAATPLESLAAARSGLRGEVPDLSALTVKLDGSLKEGWSSYLGETLRTLDLADNNLSSIRSIPAGLKELHLSNNMGPLAVRSGVLTHAVLNNTEVNLESTRLANPKDLHSEMPQLNESLKLQDSRHLACFCAEELF